jgi:hypothetical protein
MHGPLGALRRLGGKRNARKQCSICDGYVVAVHIRLNVWMNLVMQLARFLDDTQRRVLGFGSDFH